MDNADLIKTVRGLDQNSPGDNGENLQLLWNFLAAASDNRFHAAEESCLRWLLKSMNGSSEGAETLRRYPLTWTILSCVFQRIPFFSLAKSLADRKFTAVLQQTLRDVARPVEPTDKNASSKRKRSTTASFSISLLRCQQGCLETAQTLLKALKSLFDRLDSTAERFSRDKIGAEHIKSLFCTSAGDAAAIATPALQICENLLSSESCDEITGLEDWMKVITTVWDLHLQGPDDASKVAEHIFLPASTILAKLGAFTSPHQIRILDNLKKTWLVDIQYFMRRNFALPGRAAFINHRDLGAFETALKSGKDSTHLAAPALYLLTSSASEGIADGGLRKENAEWIKQIFRLVELAIRERPDRISLMESILEQAVKRSSPVPVDDLRKICRDYALHGETTKWGLVAKILQCETDVCQLSDEGIELRKEICGRIAKHHHTPDNRAAIVDIIEAVKDGFRTRRDLPGFLRLWFEQMCGVEDSKFHEDSPWFAISRNVSDKKSLTSILETEMSPQRLSEVITWVKDKALTSNPQAVSIFASTVAQAVHSEQYVDTIGRQLFDLVDRLKATSCFSPLRWRVVSTTISWVSASVRSEIWTTVKKRLTKIAEKAEVSSAETYEAFKCCYQVWDIFSPDDPHVAEAAALVETLIRRLSSEIITAQVPEASKLSSVANMELEAYFDQECGLQQYLFWILNGSSRFGRLYFDKANKLPPPLTEALASFKSSTNGLAAIWSALLHNDVNLNETKLTKSFIDRLITAFDSSEQEKAWPCEKGQLWIKALLSVPLDCFDRAQREKVMTALAKRQTSMNKSPASTDLEGWKLVIGLTSKIMKRPTFPEGLRFSELVECSEALSTATSEIQDGDETLLEVMARFSHMASTVLKQMADHVDERSLKYFREASSFVSSCGKQHSHGKSKGLDLPALHMILLRSLATELAQSTNARSHDDLAPLLKQTQHTVSKCVTKVIASCVSDKKILDNRDVTMDLSIFAATDAASAATNLSDHTDSKSSSIRKLEKRTKQAMQDGDLRAWKIQIFLRKHLSTKLEVPQPRTFEDLKKLPSSLRAPFFKELLASITEGMDSSSKLDYLKELLSEFQGGCDADGQLLAIEHVAMQIIESSDFLLQTQDGFDLSMVHSDLVSSLLKQQTNPHIICRILRVLLEKRPQCMSQWNIEITLSTVSDLVSVENPPIQTPPSYSWLCKLVEVIIKKHRLRLEGHFHLVISTMQALLRNLIAKQSSNSDVENISQEAKAHLYARLITLICEPTAGAVSRSQLHSSLDSATVAAKRSAGRHMYFMLVQYVKLQLEMNVSTEVREALEPAMNTIFDITPPEGRKILNDAMDASGRAILREMFKRYIKFGKWTGV
ncbi:hypothetical protein QQS21_002654 [Conoideocrella luteorostrata]|uniref:Nucleolar 27S pre-rRNA processing Urb2/Npa2 C-terminal domain-containing protein n=1 Tax=Conoideocrella luteorostrata TaxID=1105319 RepID=A0AAJ0CUQ6_9HYPO|nr:hypothetical protein QQS21_002654 [Conoideocrella luteorostrata]